MSAKTSFLSEERKNIEHALALIDELLLKKNLSQYEVIALGTLLQNIYQGIEGILRYRMQDAGVKFQKTENWHKTLLKESLAHGFVNETQFKGFLELLLFRHMHVHGYGYMLDEHRLREIALSVVGHCKDFLNTIE